MNSPDVNEIGTILAKFLRRFHGTMFFVVLSGLLAAAILAIISINNLVNQPPESSTPAVSSSFDEETVTRVEDLGTSSPYTPKAGSRTNPFLE
ncbi:MAG TPA: hypothetical protein PL051_01195 [Candidatus Saccharibacteria bacterium]|nr:hypothetical protein [Candidatus Saccharibacteria bacterium]